MTQFVYFGKTITVPDVDYWYNLQTGRKIKSKPVGRNDYILLDNPRVAGTKEMINGFLASNHLPLYEESSPTLDEVINNNTKTYQHSAKLTTSPTSSNTQPLTKLAPPRSQPLPIVTPNLPPPKSQPLPVASRSHPISILPSQQSQPTPLSPQLQNTSTSTIPHTTPLSPRSHPTFTLPPPTPLSPRSRPTSTLPPPTPLSQRSHPTSTLPPPRSQPLPLVNQLCKVGDVGTTLYYPNTTDIEKVPMEQLEALCTFSLLGIKTKAKIVDIVDGDTFDLAFFIPLTELMSLREEKKRGKGLRMVRPVLAASEAKGFFTKMRCRLNGIDAAEHDTAQGQEAIKVVTNKFNSINNIVYLQCYQFDKYGRLLVELYEDVNYLKSINQQFLNTVHPTLGVMFLSYTGGTKADYMKQLPKI